MYLPNFVRKRDKATSGLRNTAATCNFLVGNIIIDLEMKQVSNEIFLDTNTL